MIFKVQRSLFASDGVPRFLVYNEGRSIEEEMPLDAVLAKLFNTGEHKLYYNGERVNGAFRFTTRAPAQDW